MRDRDRAIIRIEPHIHLSLRAFFLLLQPLFFLSEFSFFAFLFRVIIILYVITTTPTTANTQKERQKWFSCFLSFFWARKKIEGQREFLSMRIFSETCIIMPFRDYHSHITHTHHFTELSYHMSIYFQLFLTYMSHHSLIYRVIYYSLTIYFYFLSTQTYHYVTQRIERIVTNIFVSEENTMPSFLFFHLILEFSCFSCCHRAAMLLNEMMWDKLWDFLFHFHFIFIYWNTERWERDIFAFSFTFSLSRRFDMRVIIGDWACHYMPSSFIWWL